MTLSTDAATPTLVFGVSNDVGHFSALSATTVRLCRELGFVLRARSTDDATKFYDFFQGLLERCDAQRSGETVAEMLLWLAKLVDPTWEDSTSCVTFGGDE